MGLPDYGFFRILVFLGLRESIPSHGAVIMATMPIAMLVLASAQYPGQMTARIRASCQKRLWDPREPVQFTQRRFFRPVLSNRLVSGTPLPGSMHCVNPNLSGLAATTIFIRARSVAPSTLAGPPEVFGSPANIIVSNPIGISVNGILLTDAWDWYGPRVCRNSLPMRIACRLSLRTQGALAGTEGNVPC